MFNFAKRINRLTFFAGVALSFAVLIVIIMLLSLIESESNGTVDGLDAFSIVTSTLLLVAFALYNVCLIKQRSNDVSGDHAVLIAVLFILSGVSFVLFFLPGEKKANQYGPIPKKGIKLI